MLHPNASHEQVAIFNVQILDDWLPQVGCTVEIYNAIFDTTLRFEPVWFCEIKPGSFDLELPGDVTVSGYLHQLILKEVASVYTKIRQEVQDRELAKAEADSTPYLWVLPENDR